MTYRCFTGAISKYKPHFVGLFPVRARSLDVGWCSGDSVRELSEGLKVSLVPGRGKELEFPDS